MIDWASLFGMLGGFVFGVTLGDIIGARRTNWRWQQAMRDWGIGQSK